MRMKVAVTVPLLFTTPALAQTELETILCIGEKATGFRLENETWQITKFNVDDDKFIVAPDGDNGDYTVTKIGQRDVISRCNRIKYGELFWHRLNCGGPLRSFAFNFQEMRYQEFYGFGYVEGNDDDASGTPALTIGKCSVIRN